MKNTIKLFLISLIAATVISCKDDEVALPDNYLTFKASEQGLTGNEATIEVSLSRAADAATTVNITSVPNGVTFGTQFTTEPATLNGTISLTIPQGSSSASFKVKTLDGVLLSGTESIDFSIANVTSPVLVGTTKSVKLSFSKIISQGSRLTLEGKEGDLNFTNTVYADLSSNSICGGR